MWLRLGREFVGHLELWDKPTEVGMKTRAPIFQIFQIPEKEAPKDSRIWRRWFSPRFYAAAFQGSRALPQAGNGISQLTPLNSSLSSARRRKRRMTAFGSCFLVLQRWSWGRDSAWNQSREHVLLHGWFCDLVQTISHL